MTDNLDDFRRNQLRQMDTHRLRECVSWGERNARGSEETTFARQLLNQRAA